MKVVTFGELMVRLQPFNYERFVQANSLEFSFGGGEANVAVSLANYGLDAAFVTKLPAHAIGQAAVNSLRRYGVDTSMITRGGDRVGIYYNEKGASQRGSVCIYDRANSAIQLAQPSDFDWDKIFEGVDWFHFTGITPALGENVVEICREACKAAKAHGVKISCDLNYRGKLWTREQARAAMTDLCLQISPDVWTGYNIIFSMGNTKIPSAPNAFSFPMISQKRFSSSTVCTELHPSCANGITVGLFIPGSTSIISFKRSVGAFIKTYFLSSAAFTASIRNKSSFRISFFSSDIFLLPISNASLFITTSTSFKLLLTKVDPELTISKIASAKLIPGAISTEPVMT